jgi:hypothetical protein
MPSPVAVLFRIEIVPLVEAAATQDSAMRVAHPLPVQVLCAIESSAGWCSMEASHAIMRAIRRA